MAPRLDAARREIAVGTRRLPFRLDLRNDRVSVTLGDAEVAVRPLQWREKLTLARFADLGPEFLREEVIRLCTLSELPSPLATEDAEVLWELAAWMSEPPTSTPVPLDSRSLATVTIRLCRAMGLKPADFDGRSAPEVEAMWDALGGGEELSEDAADDSSSVSSATRIVIVPDDGGSGDSETPAATTRDLSLGREVEHARADSGSRSRTGRSRTGVTVQSTPPHATPTSISLPNAKSEHAQAPTAAASIGAIAMTSAMTSAVTRADGDAHPRIALAPPQPIITATAPAPMRTESLGAFAMTRAGSDAHRQITLASPQPMRSAPAPVRIESLGEAAIVSADLSLSLPTEETDSAGPHDFFEELADRLEQAAAEMGIGEG